MNVLGISAFCDSSAAIIRNGEIICAVEEERLNRQKHYEGFPEMAIRECLDIAGMKIKDVDIVAVGWNPFLGWKTRIGQTLKTIMKNPKTFQGKAVRGNGYFKGCFNILNLNNLLSDARSDKRQRINKIYVDHHTAHAASSFFSSPFDEANVIVADGIGESASISLFKAKGKEIGRIKYITFPHSLGHLYASVTGFLGFQMTCDEGKVMALAGFGEDEYTSVFSKLVKIDESRGSVIIDTNILDYHAARMGEFTSIWEKLIGLKQRAPEMPVTVKHRNLACSLQKCIERSVLSLLENNFPDLDKKPLCAAGGLFLNSVMNGKISRKYQSEFFVPPASGDNGVSLGAALKVAFNNGHSRNKSNSDIYLGRNYTANDIYRSIKRFSVNAVKSASIFEDAADLISKGKVIAWFRGRMEFGPRALGNRSILANPALKGIKDRVNSKIKHREAFRPFGGSVLMDEASEYFKEVCSAPFMLKTYIFKDEYTCKFPAINHVDNSCRIQTVEEYQNPDYYKLLTEVKRKTGFGIVLNTSLNIAGEPIVNSPEEALNLLVSTEIDFLIMKDYLISRRL